MKLANFKRQLIWEFQAGERINLIVEAPDELRDVIRDLDISVQNDTEEWILSDAEEILKKTSAMEMVFSPWTMDLNNKKIQKALWKRITKLIQQDVQNEQVQNIIKEMSALLDSINEEMDYNFEYAAEDILTLMKACDVHFSEEGDLLSKLSQYIKICAELLGTRLFVFVGIKQYFTGAELDILSREAGYLGCSFMCIEGTHTGTEKNMILIDKDLCRVI